jgi:hypothetical protein
MGETFIPGSPYHKIPLQTKMPSDKSKIALGASGSQETPPRGVLYRIVDESSRR